MLVGPSKRKRTAIQIRRASSHLATALQSLDLEADDQLAEEIITALQATDRACDLLETESK